MILKILRKISIPIIFMTLLSSGTIYAMDEVKNSLEQFTTSVSSWLQELTISPLDSVTFIVGCSETSKPATKKDRIICVKNPQEAHEHFKAFDILPRETRLSLYILDGTEPWNNFFNYFNCLNQLTLHFDEESTFLWERLDSDLKVKNLTTLNVEAHKLNTKYLNNLNIFLTKYSTTIKSLTLSNTYKKQYRLGFEFLDHLITLIIICPNLEKIELDGTEHFSTEFSIDLYKKLGKVISQHKCLKDIYFSIIDSPNNMLAFAQALKGNKILESFEFSRIHDNGVYIMDMLKDETNLNCFSISRKNNKRYVLEYGRSERIEPGINSLCL